MRFFKTASEENNGKSHRICRNCKQIIRRHDKWKLVKRKVLRIFGLVLQYEHRDCNDPQLLAAKKAAEPETPMQQWLKENNEPVTTWTGDRPTEGVKVTIQ